MCQSLDFLSKQQFKNCGGHKNNFPLKFRRFCQDRVKKIKLIKKIPSIILYNLLNLNYKNFMNVFRDLEGRRMGIAANSLVLTQLSFVINNSRCANLLANRKSFVVNSEPIENRHVKINFSQWQHIQNVNTERTEQKTCKTN